MTKNLSQFLEKPHQAITLMGMSGVGKTFLSSMLEQAGWTRISCDLEISNTYLADHLPSVMKDADDIDALAKFVGLVGNPDMGGLPLEIFRDRQTLYYQAECNSIRQAVQIPDRPLVIDSTGSLCEIEDENLIASLAQKTLFVYLQASEAEREAVLERAQAKPKPLFYPPSQFPSWLQEYMRAHAITAPEEIQPKDFARAIFPKLFASRLPKYESLARKYGVIIPTSDLLHVKTADDFLAALRKAVQ